MTGQDPAAIDAFLDAVERHGGPEKRAAAERVIEAARSIGLRVAVQTTHESKGESVAFVIGGLQGWHDATPLILFARGRMSWQLRVMRNHKPFNNPDMERQLRERLSALPSTELDKPDWPDTLIDDVMTDEGLQAFSEILGWAVTRIRNTNVG